LNYAVLYNMSSYAITGASRGIGLEFATQLSANSSNTVFAIVRSPDTATNLQKLAASRPNLHVVKADVTDPQALLEAAATTSSVTGGTLDVLIHNAIGYNMEAAALAPSALPMDADAMRKLYDPEFGTTLYGAAWVTNAFLPLVEKSVQKKIVHISTGMADVELIRKAGIAYAIGYSTSKAAMNVLVAKYAAELAPKGIKTLSMSPGWVETYEGPGELTSIP
jgi:NAD(P)-dependent dehydrogenase (short-subunit alcohol dehydrogenase family)